MADVDVSLVVEWEHVSMGESERPLAMFREVKSQVAALDKRVEVIVTYDPDATDLTEMEAILDAAGLRDAPGLDVRLEGAAGHRYYALKNVGAERSRGDIIVLMDSDVIPADDWLARLLEPFQDESIQVVSGQIHVGPTDTTYRKTFALMWMFPIEQPNTEPPVYGGGYHANNVAFRREVFLRHPFRPGVRTSPNTEQVDAIKKAGVTVVRTPRARLVHPAPGDFADMRRYAFSSGYDRAAPRSRGWPRRLLWILGSPLPLGLDIKRYTQKIMAKDRTRVVGLRAAEIPVALAIAYFYALLRWAGFVLTMLAPGVIPRRYSTGSSLAGSLPEHAPREPHSVLTGSDPPA